MHAVFKLHHTKIYYMLHTMLYNRLNISVLDYMPYYIIYSYIPYNIPIYIIASTSAL